MGRNNQPFNSTNLAILGALDDFYDLYNRISDINYNKYLELKNDENQTVNVFSLQSRTKRLVRESCAEVFNKHSLLFHDSIIPHAPAYAFKSYSFFYFPRRSTETLFKAEEITFSMFLNEMFFVISNIVWKKSDTNRNLFFTMDIINKRILALVESKKEEYKKIAENSEKQTADELYIFGNLSNVKCCREKHIIEPTSFISNKRLGTERVVLPTHYCTYCNKYFIGKNTLNVFEKETGALLVRKRRAEESDSNFIGFQQESKLHQYGYNVIDGKLSSDERLDLLISLIESKRMSYIEICSTIENNIQIFSSSYRHQLAVRKWKDDLKAIGDYIIKNKTPVD